MILELVQSKIFDYMDERWKKLSSSSSIKIRIAALHHFYDTAEYEGLKWNIIEKFKPESDIVAEDRPYTKEEIIAGEKGYLDTEPDIGLLKEPIPVWTGLDGY
jgi:hypothetical protein